MNWFWRAFWPDLLSTLIGVVIGVPIALWINNYTVSLGERAKQAQERERLRQDLSVVIAAVDFNRNRLLRFADILRRKEVPFEVGLDLSAWDVTKGDLVPLLRDPVLERRIAYHFGQLNSLAKLTGLYLDQVVGVASALQGANQTRRALRNHLADKTRRLLGEIPRLTQDMQAAQEKAP